MVAESRSAMGSRPARAGSILLGLCVLWSIDASASHDIDIVTRFHQDRIERLGVPAAMEHTNATFIGSMLLDPGSPYSELDPSPRFTNEVAWAELVSSLPSPDIDGDAALAIMQWDLGMTKARPGVEVEVASGYRDPFVAASARKADVDADIFWQALNLTGNRYSTVAATYAVGLQILRAQIASTPEAERERLGIDAAVFDRLMAASHAGETQAYDLHYLATLVQFRLVHWQPGGKASTSRRNLPLAYRVARVAAAYRDTQGYVNGGPCQRDASPRLATAGTGTTDDDRPLCFVAATDRAVHRWYLREYRTQVSGFIPNQHIHDGLHKLLNVAAGIVALLDFAGFVESIEAQVAENLVQNDVLAADEALFTNERADLLSCRLPD